MFSIRRFNAIAQKEYLELKRNKLFFLMTILAPIILYFLFAYGFPLDAKNIPMGVVDFDKSSLSRSLIDNFQSATNLFNVKQVVGNYPALDKSMDLGKTHIILVIPPHFSKNIKKGEPVTLQALIDGIYPNRANLISSYAESIIGSFRDEILEEFFLKHYGFSDQTDYAIALKVSAWYNSSFRSEDFIIPGIVVIVMMFFPPLVGAISLAKEKETGSILNMYCSSITKSEYLLGKMLPYIFISFINFFIFLLITIFLFKVPMRGDPFTLMIVSIFYVASTIAIGLLIAVLVNTQIAAILITSIITLVPAFLYSGFMVPLTNVGEGARFMSYILPCTYEISLIRKIMVKGASFAHVKNDVIVIVVFCVGIYFLCIKLFKKRLG